MFDDVFYTGDICTRNRPGITGAKIPKCSTLIMECTFGMPQFRFPPIDEVVEKANKVISEMYSRGIPVILMGYEVGKVQTICKMFEHWKPLYYHERVKKINNVCRKLGADVPDAPSFEEAERSGMIQKCPWVLVAPMLSSSDKLVKRLKSEYNATTIGFSGWSAVPSHMLARRCDRMFPYTIVIIATIQSFYRWFQILVQKPCILYMDLQRNLQKHCIMFAVSRHILWSSKSDILRCVFLFIHSRVRYL